MKRFKVVYYEHNTGNRYYMIVSGENEQEAINNCFCCWWCKGSREDLIKVEEVNA